MDADTASPFQLHLSAFQHNLLVEFLMKLKALAHTT